MTTLCILFLFLPFRQCWPTRAGVHSLTDGQVYRSLRTSLTSCDVQATACEALTSEGFPNTPIDESIV